MKTYELYDALSGELIYIGTDIYAARRAYAAYDRKVAGEWIPLWV